MNLSKLAVSTLPLWALPALVAADTLGTAAPNNQMTADGGGVFFNLTAAADRNIQVTALTYYPGTTTSGLPVTVDVGYKAGTYVGFDTNAGAWISHTTLNTTVPLGGVPVQISLSPAISIAAGQTVGIYIVGSDRGIRFTGTSTLPPQTTWSNGRLTLFSDRARTFPFGGTLQTPRCYAGTVTYSMTLLTGACCLSDGTCQQLTPGACSTAAGTFSGFDSACASANCPPGGACCLANGSCQVRTTSACAAAGGVYRGNSTICASANCPQPGTGQWTVTNLHPAGTWYSVATGVSSSQQVGYASVENRAHASLWSGSATSWVDLHPAGGTISQANGVSGGQQVGYVDQAIGRASLWSGSVASFVDLSPVGATQSAAFGVYGGQQVGWAAVGGFPHASLWNGSAASWVDLHPAGATRSGASVISGGQQAGNALVGGQYHASLWSGSAASWVDLSPAGATWSVASGVFGGQQVGIVAFDEFGELDRASLWSGFAASWVNLNPVGATQSGASGVCGGQQVGWAAFDEFGESERASLWSGSAASWVDLHAFLPAGFSSSVAAGIWSDANSMYVVGSGYNTLTNRSEALLWTRVNCYANCDNSTAAPTLNINDLTCFLNTFVAADPYANCDHSTSPPVLNIFDFLCFLNRFAAGCP